MKEKEKLRKRDRERERERKREKILKDRGGSERDKEKWQDR